MFEWMLTHKKNIMKYTLFLVIPSFVLLYGYGQCAKPVVYKWVAKVNGEEISEYALSQWVENVQRRLRMYQQELPYDEVRNQALEMAIVFKLYDQKAEKWGVATTDEELLDSIRSMKAFQDENGNFNPNYYKYAILNSGFRSLAEFEQQQRNDLTQQKVQSIVQNAIVGAKPEKERLKNRQQQKVSIEYLAFQPSSYTEEVQPATEEMKAFFEENIEDYRVPEQRKIGYVKYMPADYIQDVSFNDRDTERYFNRKAEEYKIPEKVRVEYLMYSSQAFADTVEPTEEDLRAYYQQHTDQFMHPERIKARFVKLSVEELANRQAVEEAKIESYYQENQSKYEHGEQVRAKHIILEVTPEASESQDEAVKNRILEIRQEIVDGMPFEEAAKKYSEGPSGKEGGDLGMKPKGYFDADFEKAAFDLPLGQLSEPVKTRFGYHLILVEEREQAGTTPLSKVRDEIAQELQMEALKEQAASLQSLDELPGDHEIQTTDWFARNEEIPGVESRDRFTFYFAATRENEQQVRFAGNPRMEHVYLIEPLEKQEKRPKTFDEARNEIAEKVKQEQAADIAAVAAQEDINRVKEENLTLEQIAENRGLSIQTSSLFSKQDQFIPEFGRAPMQLVNTAFNLEEGQVTGPFTVNQNTCIIRLLTREEPYIPEFEEVSEQVKSDYRRYLAEREARRDAGIFSDTVFEKGISLQAGANEKGVEYQETDFFAQNQPIPDLGFKRNLSQAAFEMDETGIVSREVEERTRNPRQRTEGPVEAYYVFELLEIKETYLPEFQEVAGDVEEDYRLVLAEDVAVEKAGQTLSAIKSELASGQPYSSTRAINLEAFAEDGEKNVTEGANYNGPIDVNGLGSVPGVGRAVEFAKTALSLEKGQVSGLVKNYRQKRTQQDERPQQGPMTGVYILQSLGAVEPDETEADTINRFTQMVDRQMGSSAFAAWVDEVSAAATIDYNDEYFNPKQEDTEGMEESEVAQDETASS